jgi:5-methylcytosine-specific restriction protein A
MPGDPWTVEETEALVEAYMELAKLIARGEEVNKQQVYRKLSSQYGRSQSIYPRKFCSISCVLADMGMPWVPGLPPLNKFGAATTEAIRQLLVSKGYTLVAEGPPTPEPDATGIKL